MRGGPAGRGSPAASAGGSGHDREGANSGIEAYSMGSDTTEGEVPQAAAEGGHRCGGCGSGNSWSHSSLQSCQGRQEGGCS